MDYKYLNDRYQKGIDAIGKLMDQKHRLVRFSSATLAHATIIQAQADMGNKGSLGFDSNATFFVVLRLLDTYQ